MTELTTIFSSNAPVECYILKGRLETEGIPCFIFDEHIISVHPFRAVAIGGVKLKVPNDRIDQALNIIKLLAENKLIDENGEYQTSEVFENEIKRQNEILLFKHKIRSDPNLLEMESDYSAEFIDQSEFEEIIKQEREFLSLSKRKFDFSWDQFLAELFDFNRNFFKYLRTKPADYYIEKEIVENYINQKEPTNICHCPYCNSDNVAFGYAIDYKWDITYLIISILLGVPLFFYRKKYHCFDCGFNFTKRKTVTANQ